MPEADRQIIKRMQDGDQEAFQDFARAWYPRIVKWILPRTSNDKISDYAQEVWIHLTKNGCQKLLQWRGLDATGPVHPNSLAAFLRVVTVLKVIEMHRKDNKQWLDYGDDANVIDDDGQLGRNPSDTVEGEQIKVQFRECFGFLPLPDKRMLIMKWNGRSDNDIASLFRMTANNVRQRRYQMIKRLRECLSDKLPAYFSSE